MNSDFKVKTFDVDFAKMEVVLHREDAAELGVRPGARIKIATKKRSTIAIVNTTEKFVREGEIGVFEEVKKELGLKKGDVVCVHGVEKPESVDYIKKKLAGEKLMPKEIQKIVDDMVSLSMSEIEISAWVCSLQTGGMDMDEIVNLTNSMANSGEKLELDGAIFDKHSIGGVPGNKITPLIVPIVAACGLKIPKTSSRAITSPSGTADVIENFCRVDLNLEQIREVVEKTSGCMVWGGAVDLAPADDLMIQAEYPLDLDPRPLLLASVMSKKKAVNANYCVIDIPVGRGAKIDSMQEGEKLARDFIELGSRLKMQVECALTYASQPIGYAVGPALEAKEALETLIKGHGPESLVEKSCALAGMLLEIGGVAKVGEGSNHALEVLRSGRAYTKFKEIIEAQDGDPEVKPAGIKIGKKSVEIKADMRGYISRIENSGIKLVARCAGAPKDKGAGILLTHKVGKKVHEGETLFAIYSNSAEKLERAEALAKALKPIKIENMLLETITSSVRIK